MSLLIDQAGLHSTVQDLGRPGYYSSGVPLGGAMDTFSHEVANCLVGNEPSCATIECTYTGPRFTVDEPTVMAVTGGEMAVSVNSSPAPPWVAVRLAPGDLVECGPISAGGRSYLAFSGGIDVPIVLGSRSTYTAGKIGGFEGRPLAPDDRVRIGAASEVSPEGRSLRESLRPTFSRTNVARIVLGPYDHRVTDASLEMLASQEWRLSLVADRTGLRFDGDADFEFVPREQPFGAGSNASNIVDAGYPMGSIQIPGGGQPIILHRDAVSIGGYAAIATVISADLNTVAQLVPKSTLRFEVVTIDQALSARVDERRHRNAALSAIAE